MKYMVRFATLIVLLFAFGASAAANGLQNLNNPHNLQYHASATNAVRALDPASGGTTEICVFCHTPHGATPQSVLWNRNDIDPNSPTSFELYNSATLQISSIPGAQYNTADPAKYPNGASRMCLSCHDGSTAMGYGIGSLATGDSIAMTVSNLNGRSSQIDLTQSHPISFVYTASIASTISTNKGFSYAVPLDTDVTLDGQQRMQCTTCHDPHDATQNDGAYPKFWVKKTLDAYNDVCLACHEDWNGLPPEFGSSDPIPPGDMHGGATFPLP